MSLAATPTLPGTIFIFLVLSATALICYLVRRWAPVAGLLAAASCLLLGWLTVAQSSGESLKLLGRVWVSHRPFVLLGRAWVLTSSNLAVLTLVLVSSGLVFLLSVPFPQGWAFYSLGTAVLAVLVLAVAAQQYIYAILFLWVAAILVTFVLSGGRPGATTGAFRYLVITTLAVMPLLTLTGYLGAGAAVGATYAASVLLVIGASMLLMFVPFHGQLVAIAGTAAPMVPAYFFATFPLVILYVLLGLSRSFPELLAEELFFDLCRWLGTAAVVAGGVVALAQRRWGFLVGYALLVDWGAGLIALGQGTASGFERMVQMMGWRTISLLAAGMGLSIVYQAAGKSDELVRCRGLWRRRTLGVTLLVGGVLSLAGFPLTPGAAGRWQLLVSLWPVSPRTVWVLILGGVGVCIGAIVGLRACLGQADEPVEEKRGSLVVTTGFALLALWIVGMLLFRPSSWLALTERLLGDLSFLQ